jgi:hypothetical protein
MKKKPAECHIALTPTGGRDHKRALFIIKCKLDGPLTEGLKQQVTEIFITRFLLPFLPREFAEKYEWAYYEGLLHSAKKRRAMDFLRIWNYNRGAAKEDGRGGARGRKFLAALEPLLDALEKHDAEFFSGLAEAMRILQSSRHSSALARLHKWLFDYAIENRWEKKHTPRELNEQFVSKFHNMKDKKLHEKLHELGIPHKDEPRGKASPNYGVLLNLPPKRRRGSFEGINGAVNSPRDSKIPKTHSKSSSSATCG